MKKSGFSESQIVAILKELDAGMTATELGRRNGIHPNTIRLCKDEFAGLVTSYLARLKQLEDESRRKNRIIARLTMEIDAVRELMLKSAFGPRSEEKR